MGSRSFGNDGLIGDYLPNGVSLWSIEIVYSAFTCPFGLRIGSNYCSGWGLLINRPSGKGISDWRSVLDFSRDGSIWRLITVNSTHCEAWFFYLTPKTFANIFCFFLAQALIVTFRHLFKKKFFFLEGIHPLISRTCCSENIISDPWLYRQPWTTCCLVRAYHIVDNYSWCLSWSWVTRWKPPEIIQFATALEQANFISSICDSFFYFFHLLQHLTFEEFDLRYLFLVIKHIGVLFSCSKLYFLNLCSSVAQALNKLLIST